MIKYTNNARSRLASSLSSSATTATIVEGDYPDFLAAGTGEMFARLRTATKSEVVKVDISGSNAVDGLDIQRGQDGTTATSFPRGAAIYQAVTATVLESFLQKGGYRHATATNEPLIGFSPLTPQFFGEEVFSDATTSWYKGTATTSATCWVSIA